MPTIKEITRDYILGDKPIIPGGSPADEERKLFIGNEMAIRKVKLREYATWYEGDGDRLLALYNKDNLIDFVTEPYFWKNKRSYFWAVSSTEDDVKRTHSGLPANMVNTMCNLVGTPTFNASDEKLTRRLNEILDNCNFWATYIDEQLPMTMVEGWGAYKVSWDVDFCDDPFIVYYRAENVDFYKVGGKTVGMVFYDWYKGEKEGERYLMTEIRKIKSRVVEDEGPTKQHIERDLVIKTNLWKVLSSSDTDAYVHPLDTRNKDDIPDVLKGVEEGETVITNFDSLLARECVVFKDATDSMMPGKSVYANNIEKFDMLDATISQEDNAIQKSTVEELFNTDFLERDKNGMPIMPKRYDRKYTTFAGGRTAEGGQMSADPVQVTQPSVDFSRYSNAALEIVGLILSGYMSPSTVGIGVAVQSTAESQREKEKVTIATRNKISLAETRMLKGIFSDLLCVDEYLHSEDRAIKTKRYDISIKYSEFADVSFEEKAQVLVQVLGNAGISPELYVKKLHGDSLTEEEFQKEVEFINKLHDPEAQQEMMAEAQGGMNPSSMMEQILAQGNGGDMNGGE